MTHATTVVSAQLLAGIDTSVAAVVVRDGPATIVAAEPSEVIFAEDAGALGALSPGWWAGYLSYDLGRSIENFGGTKPTHFPRLALARFESRVILEDVKPPRIDGDEYPAANWLREASRAIAGPGDLAAQATPWRSSLTRDEHDKGVRQILDYLAAGDCYQVNLTRRLECEWSPNLVALQARLTDHNPAPHSAFVGFENAAIVSASPELFLRRDGKKITTRPIKGTGKDAQLLRRSAKDRAENVMIVDLSRNDLGRVCDFGTVQVEALCEVESHPGLHHLVSTVTGTLKPDTTPTDIIVATFPPASVTGAPKPRVLQIIEELERVPREIYCGAIGFIDTENDRMELNVAIRTFFFRNEMAYFGVGGGIVADSDPDSEWRETELKADRFLDLAREGRR